MCFRPFATGNDPFHIPEAVHGRPSAGVGDHRPVIPSGPASHVRVGRRTASARWPGHGGHGYADVRRAERDVAVPGGRVRL